MRARRWRTALIGPPRGWSLARKKVEMRTSQYHAQIVHDVRRTFADDEWFDPHRMQLAEILNTFATINSGVGYIQGMNYLIFPLWKVYFNASPMWAVEDTMASLQSILQLTLRTYATRADDTRAYDYINTIVGVVRLRAITLDNSMSVLCGQEYTPFLQSTVSSMVPTLFANALSIDSVFLLWDQIFAAKTRREMFDRAVNTLVCLIVHHRNLFVHMSFIRAMDIFERLCSHTLDQYVVRKSIQVFMPNVRLRQTTTTSSAADGRGHDAEGYVRDGGRGRESDREPRVQV